MKNFRKLLFPFTILYGIITNIRNYFYKIGIFKRTSFLTPVIVVGNLSVGGTGKTPMVEYIIRLLKDKYSISTLSRGYKRKSEGFILANANTTMEEIGDEPFQYHCKFDTISVAVDTKRVNGIQNILKLKPQTQVIILDDAYQHLAVKSDFNILLTTYDQPYYKDYLLPAGNLRESRKGAKRAQIIVVTKCPEKLSKQERKKIVRRLNLTSNQKAFFTSIEFSKIAYSKSGKIDVENLQKEDFILVAGIAKPKTFFDHLKKEDTICLSFPDHHHFSSNDISLILQSAKGGKIVTTEKDYVRLTDILPAEKLYYLPIQTSFVNFQKEFDQTILNYVGKSTANS